MGILKYVSCPSVCNVFVSCVNSSFFLQQMTFNQHRTFSHHKTAYMESVHLLVFDIQYLQTFISFLIENACVSAFSHQD
jgi:hypothetical protein